MTIASYSDLVSQVADFMGRSDLTTKIDTFISFVEAEINREWRTLNQLERTTLTLTTGTATVALPDDFLQLNYIGYSGSSVERLRHISLQDLRQQYYDFTGCPTAYAYDEANTLHFAPTPDDAYELDLVYYEKIPALTSSNTSNWLLARDPRAYFVGCMAFAAEFVEDDATFGRFATQWQGISQQYRAQTTRDKAAHSRRRQFQGLAP